MAQAPDRDKALELALAQIDKQFGKGSIMRLGDDGRAALTRRHLPPMRPDLLDLFEKEELAKYLTDEELTGR